MSSWDELFEAVRRVEDLLYRMRIDREFDGVQALYDESTGCYSRGYLLHRLPAEVDRSHRTGRPFSLLLFRFRRPAFDSAYAPLVRRVLRTFLYPMDVPIRYAYDALLCLLPETDGEVAHDRLAVLVDGFAIAGFQGRDTLRRAATTYWHHEPRPLSTLLSELEASTGVAVHEVAIHEADGQETEKAEDSPSNVDPEEGPTSRPAPEPPPPTSTPMGNAPVAVGFVPGQDVPVSFWYQEEPVPIVEILEDDGGDGRRVLRVKTPRGVFLLVQAGGRWLASPAN